MKFSPRSTFACRGEAVRLCLLTVALITVLLAGPAANADYDDARAAAAEGRYRQSITLFQEAVAAAANDTDLRRALWGLADVYRQQQ